MAATISNVADCGMPGSKQFDVTLTGDDLTYQNGVWVKAVDQVPVGISKIPEDGTWTLIGQVNPQNGVAHCSVLDGCTAGRFIVALVDTRKIGGSASQQMAAHPFAKLPLSVAAHQIA